jgi:PAS domain S-box-containing protein
MGMSVERLLIQSFCRLMAAHPSLQNSHPLFLRLSQDFNTLNSHNNINNKSNNYKDQAFLDSLAYPILCHSGTPTSTHDPLFIFANQKALELFDYSAEELLGLPSRLSAEPDHRQARRDMIRSAASQGYVSGYEGVRVTSKGQRFRIKNALVWNVCESQGGRVIGQAALLPEWSFDDVAS